MSGTAFWYLTRATGVVSLVLLTLTVLLGIALSLKQRLPGLQRFVVRGLHRNVALLAVAFLVVHIGTAVLDSYVPIDLKDVVVPFVAQYQPLWVGLGACAVDLLLAVLLTTAVQRRLGHRRWKAVHYLAYAAFPVAVLHGFTTGTDLRSGLFLGAAIVCSVAVVAATGRRIEQVTVAPVARVRVPTR